MTVSTRFIEGLSTLIAPESPGNTHYKDRRLLALYFDLTAMPQADQLRALGIDVAVRGGALRISPSYYNDRSEIERLVQQLSALHPK